uniref:Uncharacterized protein n=1 Tax=mine drainage metagenome TaxID=410659 RepID=E6PVR8_9ZZZZ
MIVAGRIGNTEFDGNVLQKSGGRRCEALRLEVRADMKHQPITPGREGGILQQRGIAAPVGVGDRGAQLNPGAGTFGQNGDVHAGGRFATGGVEDVRGQLTHIFAYTLKVLCMLFQAEAKYNGNQALSFSRIHRQSRPGEAGASDNTEKDREHSTAGVVSDTRPGGRTFPTHRASSMEEAK